MAINVPLNAQFQNANQAATYLQGVLQGAVNKVQFNLGGANNAKSLSSLSQPLGRLTGQADEFTKSLDAANARVLAFGASVGIVNAVSNAFKALVNSTIEVEKAVASISVVGDQFNGKTKELTQGLFNVAKVTSQSFDQVSKAALEFSRQGLGVEETLSKTKDALILTRLTGLDAAKSVDGLTAAFNAFSKAGISSSEILNKLAAVDQAFAVSSADLIEGFNRSAAVAQNAGVTFDELAGIITALQQDTSRGGSVIGNALKTIFTRLQDTSTLNKLQGLGIAVKDLENNILPVRQILQNLAGDVEGLGKITQSGIFKDVAGAFQINQLISLVGDLNRENSIAAAATKKSAGATNEAYVANEKLNQSLNAIVQTVALTGKQLGSLLGEIGLVDTFKVLIQGLNSFLETVNNVLQGEDIGSRFAQGLVKGIGSILTGPGIGLFLAIIAKLGYDLIKFSVQGLRTFLNIGKAAADQKQVQESIVQALLKNQNVLSSIVNTQGGQNAQGLKFLGILNQQAKAMQAIQVLAGGVASTVYAGGYRATAGGLQRKAAGGYLPAQEASDVSRGVGGASPSSKVVSIPNFAFGGGQRGTMIANTSEYIVPNYAGGGSAIFNQDMVRSMGLPPGAQKISAAGGFIPNFKEVKNLQAIQEGKLFEKQLNFKLFKSKIEKGLRTDYDPNGPLDFPLPDGYGKNLELRKSLGINPNSIYGDAKRTRNRKNEQSLIDKYLRTSQGKADFLSADINKKGFINLSPKGLSMVFLNEGSDLKSNAFIGTNNLSLSKGAQKVVREKLGKSKKSFTIALPYLADQINSKSLFASQGYIPNFADENNNDLAVLGLYGENGAINGSPVYTLQSQRPDLAKNIEDEYKVRVKSFVRSYSQELASKIGIKRNPKEVIKAVQSSSSVSGFIFEDVLNQLAGPDFDSNRLSGGSRADFPLNTNLRKIFGASGPQKYAEVKLNPYTTDSVSSVLSKQKALAGGALGPQEISGDKINEFKARALALGIGQRGRVDTKTQSQRNAFIKELIDAKIIKSGYGTSADQTKAIKRSLGMASGGYVPNFAAAALQQAIAREKTAGLSNSQIYVDQNPSLKSNMNPMGLMVANTRDEPAGGFQGISRARKEGANPKTYGAANGFIPNYAVQSPIGQVSAIKGILKQDKVDAFNKALADTAKELKNNQISLSQAEQNIEIYARTVGASAKGQNILISEGKKLIQAYDAEYQVRKQKAQELRTQRAEKQNSQTVNSPKSAGDSLAKVFALQSAFLGLSAVVDTIAGEGSEFAETFKKVDGVLTGIASAATLLSAGLGPLGIALATVTAGFNIVRSVWPNAIQQMVEAFGGLSKSGQEASKNLDQFGQKIASGGVSPQQALEDAKKQAQEAQLRIQAKQIGVSTENAEGRQKDPAKLARETVISNFKKRVSEKDIFQGIDFYKPSENITGNLKFKDLNESSQNVIVDILEETVSSTKEGLLAIAKELNITKNPKDLINQKDLLNFRSEILDKLLFSEGDLQLILQKASYAARNEKDLTFDQKKFQEAIKNGGLQDFIVKFIQDSLKNLPKVEGELPVNQIQENLDGFIRGYNNFTTEINRSISATTALFEGAVSSQAFSGLGLRKQSELKSQLDRFKSKTSYEQSQRSLIGESRTLISEQTKNLAGTEGMNQGDFAKLQDFVKSFSNLGTLETDLKEFESTLNLAGDAGRQIKNSFNDLINKNKDLQSNYSTEAQLLEFSIKERQSELNAIETFYKGLSQFNRGIREKESQLRRLDFSKSLVEQTAQFEKDLAQITSTSPEELRARTRAADTKKLQSEAGLNLAQAQIQAQIERDREINTIDNITALNKNTVALEELVKQISVEGLQKRADKIILGASGRSVTPEEAGQLKSITDQMIALTNPPASNGTNVRNPSDLIKSVKSPEDISQALTNFGIVNEELRAKYTQTLENYFNTLKVSSETERRKIALQELANANEDKLNQIKNSYTDELSLELRSLRESQKSPKSRGEYAATERQIDRMAKQGSMTEEGVRNYRSSLGYGLSQGFEELEKRTLDYKQELGVAIPNLFSQNLAQGLNDAISGAKDLKTALTDAATSFFQEITRKNISNLADLVTGGFGTFGNVLGKASGGFISGGSGNKDDVPAMLMGGEYVVKKSAVSKYGKGFLDSLNNGSMRGYATGGLVDPQTFPTQTGRGGFFTPGDYGQGAITGKNELLAFATQTNTGGQYDYMGGFGMNGATVSLEPESARLSATGRENSPMFERIQQSKDEAFRVYLEGLQKEKEYADLLDQIAKDKKARKKQLQTAIISAVISSAASYAGNTFATGAKNASASSLAAGGKGGFLTSVKGGFSNLGNLFSPSKALGLNSDAQFLKSIGVNSYKDLRKLPIENSLKFAQQYPNIGTTYTNFFGTKRAAGGLISGGSNIRDDVPAMLTGGEFVLNNRATQRIGLQNLTKLNNGQTTDSGTSSTDMTQALISKLDELIQATQNSSSDNVVVNVSTSEAGGQSQDNAAGTEKELGKKIKQAVLDVIAQEKRLGGSLEKAR